MVQRDEWVSRYAELMELETRSDCPGFETGGRGHVGVATKIADETGLFDRTVRRILAPPKPAPEPAPATEPESAEPPAATPTGDPLDIPSFLDRRPKPAPAAVLDEDERGRAAKHLASLLSEFSHDQHAGIATALELLGPAVADIARRFAAMSTALYGAKAA